jgi:CspA family cold shock protein
MPTGSVKWFDTKKGYGFIMPDNGTSDVFVHMSAVKSANLFSLEENQRIEYQIATEKGKTSAVDLKILS